MASGEKPTERGRSNFIVEWFTVSYRTIYIIVAILLIGTAVIGYIYVRRSSPPLAGPSDVPPSTVTSARFTAIEGSVKFKAIGTFEWANADRKTILHRGDLVRTASNASADITFFDGTVVRVRPESLITIEETSENPHTKQRRVSWHISSGEVNYQTARRNVEGSSTEVTTPTLKMRHAELTEGGIRVDEEGDSDVRIFKGAVDGQTKTGHEIHLAANEGLRVDSKGAVGPKLVLPVTPTPVSPENGVELSYPNPRQSTTMLIWNEVANVASYHVMLDQNPAFARPVRDELRRGPRFEARGLDVGRYYWRVAAVGKDNAEGAFSEPAMFVISRSEVAPLPPLEIGTFALRQNILQIKGRTEPGATVIINGQQIDVGSDGTFNEFVTLDRTGRQNVIIRAVGLQGGVREERRSVDVTF
ncbi:MAG: FecR domain-containing protein [Vicinamibacteria bacterium]|nr:FecR domain-containing protein [Vicinamibacteria bacterium]